MKLGPTMRTLVEVVVVADVDELGPRAFVIPPCVWLLQPKKRHIITHFFAPDFFYCSRKLKQTQLCLHLNTHVLLGTRSSCNSISNYLYFVMNYALNTFRPWCTDISFLKLNNNAAQYTELYEKMRKINRHKMKPIFKCERNVNAAHLFKRAPSTKRFDAKVSC